MHDKVLPSTFLSSEPTRSQARAEAHRCSCLGFYCTACLPYWLFFPPTVNINMTQICWLWSSKNKTKTNKQKNQQPLIYLNVFTFHLIYTVCGTIISNSQLRGFFLPGIICFLFYCQTYSSYPFQTANETRGVLFMIYFMDIKMMLML